MLVSVSTMPAEDVVNYAKKIQIFADFLHCDICDGQYNQTQCFSPDILKQINNISTIPLDCHLMTKNPINYAKTYIDNGANIITAQIESFETEKDILDFINFVKSNGTLAGISLEPQTNVQKVLPYMDKLDIILIMSVNTGKGGQQFNKSVLSKIEYLSNIKRSFSKDFLIEVDGGINDKIAKELKVAGADIIVIGSFVYKAKDTAIAIQSLK